MVRRPTTRLFPPRLWGGLGWGLLYQKQDPTLTLPEEPQRLAHFGLETGDKLAGQRIRNSRLSPPRKPCRSTTSFAVFGGTPLSRRMPAASRASTGSLTRYACWRRCAKNCAARKSGSLAPTGTATRMRTFRPISRHRTAYYQALNLPADAEQFIVGLQTEMREALRILDRSILSLIRRTSPLSRLNWRRPGR
jgi:hypothetical protein